MTCSLCLACSLQLLSTGQTSVLLSIWPRCLQSTVGEVEQAHLISALGQSSEMGAAVTLGLASSHRQLSQTATDALIERVKRDGAKALETVVADKELVATLARPDLLPRVANTRLFPAVCQQIVRAMRQPMAQFTTNQRSDRASQRRSALPTVFPCAICQSQLVAATEADADGTAEPISSSGADLLPMSLAHLVSQRLYPQAVHLVYSVLQTHEYMRSLPAGLAEVHVRLRAASQGVVTSVVEGGERGRLVLYEAALKRLKDDGVGQSG